MEIKGTCVSLFSNVQKGDSYQDLPELSCHMEWPPCTESCSEAGHKGSSSPSGVGGGVLQNGALCSRRWIAPWVFFLRWTGPSQFCWLCCLCLHNCVSYNGRLDTSKEATNVPLLWVRSLGPSHSRKELLTIQSSSKIETLVEWTTVEAIIFLLGHVR